MKIIDRVVFFIFHYGYILMILFTIFIFIYISIKLNGVILLEGGSNDSSSLVLSDSRGSNSHSSIMSPGAFINHGLYEEPGIDNIYYGDRNSSHAYNTQYHANLCYQAMLGLQTILGGTNVYLELSTYGPLSQIDPLKDLVSQIYGTTLVIKNACTIEIPLQVEALEYFKLGIHHMNFGYSNAIQADIDIRDGVYGIYGSSPDSEKSITDSLGNREQPTTDLDGFRYAKRLLRRSLNMLVRNRWE